MWRGCDWTEPPGPDGVPSGGSSAPIALPPLPLRGRWATFPATFHPGQPPSDGPAARTHLRDDMVRPSAASHQALGSRRGALGRRAEPSRVVLVSLPPRAAVASRLLAWLPTVSLDRYSVAPHRQSAHCCRPLPSAQVPFAQPGHLSVGLVVSGQAGPDWTRLSQPESAAPPPRPCGPPGGHLITEVVLPGRTARVPVRPGIQGPNVGLLGVMTRTKRWR